MSNWRTHTLSGWGQTSATTVDVARPERLADLKAIMAEPGPILAHGLGRSYGDAPVPKAGARAVLLHRLDRMLSFDEASGLLVAEAGITLQEIVRTFLPRGWLLPALPGTAQVTLGGAIGQDVHGKNHPDQGSFGGHVDWLDLILPSGEERRVSRSQFPEIFFATLGGIGLTGIVVRAAVRLKKVPGAAMAVTAQRVAGLDEMFAAFNSSPPEDTYRIGWVDALARGKNLGRGIFERSHPVAEAGPVRRAVTLPFPFRLPNFALNPLSIGAFNPLRYYTAAPARPATHLAQTPRFLFPLDWISNWNRMYGRRGFHQFQAALPLAGAEGTIRRLLEAIAASRRASFLTTIKRYGPEGEGYLSYPLEGYTLALDFPNGAGVAEFLQGLVKLTRDAGGRVYLAKDSVLTADDFAAMYPRLPLFRKVLAEVDPARRMASQMADRLGLREAT